MNYLGDNDLSTQMIPRDLLSTERNNETYEAVHTLGKKNLKKTTTKSCSAETRQYRIFQKTKGMKNNKLYKSKLKKKDVGVCQSMGIKNITMLPYQTLISPISVTGTSVSVYTGF